MARGDVISDGEVSIAASTNVSLQPGVGVEWLITEIIQDAVGSGETSFRPISTATDMSPTMYPGITSFAAPSKDVPLFFTGTSRKLMLTNSQYIIIRNNAGSTKYWAYFGVQMG